MVQNISGNLDDVLSKWMKQIQNQTTGMTLADKTAISEAGGKVFMDALRKETKAKHYSNKKDPKWGHMADHISIMLDGKSRRSTNTDFNGGVIVGWDNRYHAMNVMRLNDGTKQIVGDHFLTNLRNNNELRSKILQAEKSKYEEIANKKGDD